MVAVSCDRQASVQARAFQDLTKVEPRSHHNLLPRLLRCQKRFIDLSSADIQTHELQRSPDIVLNLVAIRSIEHPLVLVVL